MWTWDIKGQDIFPRLEYSPLAATPLGDGVGTEGLFNGYVDNMVIHNYSIGALPSITGGPLALPDTNMATSESLTLTPRCRAALRPAIAGKERHGARK